LSASPQCRRRGPSAAERTSISGLNLWSAIRSDLSPASKSRQTASTGGIRPEKRSPRCGARLHDGRIADRRPAWPTFEVRTFRPFAQPQTPAISPTHEEMRTEPPPSPQ
jgi:hypothetical protein